MGWALSLLLLLVIAIPGMADTPAPAPDPTGGDKCLTEVDQIMGLWRFYKYKYRGQDMPPRDPKMVLSFSFHSNGMNFLSWSHKEDPLFCERMGKFSFEDCTLKETVTWTNPENSKNCSADPDMREGTVNANRMAVIDGELHLYLTLSGEPLTYVWRRVQDRQPEEPNGQNKEKR